MHLEEGNWANCVKRGQRRKRAARLRATGPFSRVRLRSTARIPPPTASFATAPAKAPRSRSLKLCRFPHEFDFLIPGKRESRHARLVWRHGAQAGVTFVASPVTH